MHRDATVSLSKSSGIDGIVARFLDRPGLAAGHVSVWLGPVSAPVAGPATYAREQHRRHYAASTMKLPLLVAAYRCHERGEIDLDAEVEVHAEFGSVLDGSPFELARDDDQDEATWDRVGSTAPLRWLARQSIVCSGNLATNLVLEPSAEVPPCRDRPALAGDADHCW